MTKLAPHPAASPAALVTLVRVFEVSAPKVAVVGGNQATAARWTPEGGRTLSATPTDGDLDTWWIAQGRPALDALVIEPDPARDELSQLRGARELLRPRRVRGVIAPARLVRLRDGAPDFVEIDGLLRSAGFTVHQIDDLEPADDDLATDSPRALWLRHEAADALRYGPGGTVEPEHSVRFKAVVRKLLASGITRLALYGAGRHTLKLTRVIPQFDADWLGVIDDDPARVGEFIAGLPIVSATRAMSLGVQAVVLSSDSFEAGLWARSAPLRRAGVQVRGLYAEYPANTNVGEAA